jgi:hypothetical protein
MSIMDDPTITPLSADVVIRDGGWDPRYARVLLIEQNGVQALVLFDGYDNDDGWDNEASSGHCALDSLTSADTWRAGEFVCALGRVSPGTVVRVSYGGRTYSREANAFGLWGFAHKADSPRADELPAVATPA